MKDCYEFYVTDTNLLFDTTAKNISDFLSNESAENQYFNNIRFCILECRNALLIKFSYGDTERNDILNIRIFKNEGDRLTVRGKKVKVFSLIFGLLKESVDRYEESKTLAYRIMKRNGFGVDPGAGESISVTVKANPKMDEFLDEIMKKWK